jgi:2,3-bisphosphoglycerate-independent phosphoglycerate mutase
MNHQKPKHPVILIVLDGWGHRADTNHNAIANARTPFFDSLWAKYPHAIVEALGDKAVFAGRGVLE